MFLRSSSGTDPVNALWVFDVDAGRERLVADPRAVLSGDDEDLPAAERARRERTRERASGFVTYDTDPRCTTAVAALGGRLVLVDLVGDGGVTSLDTPPAAFDPRLSPTADHVAYVVGPGPAGRRGGWRGQGRRRVGPPRRLVGIRRVRGRRGDGAHARPLVVPRREAPGGGQGGRGPGRALAPGRPGRARQPADEHEVPRRRHRQRHRRAVGLRPRRHRHPDRMGHGHASLPGERQLVGRRRPGRRRAEPGPAHDGRPAGGPCDRRHHPPAPAGGRGVGRHRGRDAGMGRRAARHRRELRRGAAADRRRGARHLFKAAGQGRRPRAGRHRR